jgi:hypothetical protein
VSVLRERGMIGNIAIKPQPAKPSIREMIQIYQRSVRANYSRFSKVAEEGTRLPTGVPYTELTSYRLS